MTAIAIVGEAWGAEEEIARRPFVGASGQELTRMLAEAGIDRDECFLTNVFNFRPKGNEIDTLCVPKTALPKVYTFPAISKGRYIDSQYLPELDRLFNELREAKPNLILALGGTASWALLGRGGISSIRGAVAQSARGWKVLPTYHPAAALRDWSLRHVTILDFQKGKRESAFPEIRRVERRVYFEPTLGDLEAFFDSHITGAASLAFDIETARGQITCIGFAPTIDKCLVVPFFDPRKPGFHYWPSLAEELAAWRFVARVLATDIPKVAQNGLYDVQWLWMRYGIKVTNFAHDTMLLHHVLQPESEKGLGFLGSVYTNEPAWKTERIKGQQTIKRED